MGLIRSLNPRSFLHYLSPKGWLEGQYVWTQLQVYSKKIAFNMIPVADELFLSKHTDLTTSFHHFFRQASSIREPLGPFSDHLP